MLTLFCILLSNNWNSYVTMFATLKDSNGPYYFFSIYYILAIMVLLNIVVSFIMEIYSLVLESSQPSFQKLQMMKKVQKWAPEQKDLEDLIRKTPALQRPLS
mmetsp:Transcript_42325/g.55786  ORF Transcript_42325/g.55786 Transcript_42325/m.55786 type:complete len:102 (+) Transcript_42325:67-372(+)